MQSLAGIAFLCFLSVGCTYGQGEDFVDFDAFALDYRNEDIFQDRDIFQDDPEPFDRAAEAIERLCAEYDILLDDKSIDCKKLKLIQKALQIDHHSLQKRDAEEDVPLEGSGEGEELPPNEETKAEPESDPVEEQPPPEAEPQKEVEHTETSDDVKAEEAALVNELLQAKEEEANAESQAEQQPAPEVENSEVPADIKETPEVPEIAANSTNPEAEIDNKESEVPAENPPESDPAPEVTEASPVQENEEENVAVPLEAVAEGLPVEDVESELTSGAPPLETDNEEQVAIVPLDATAEGLPPEGELPVAAGSELTPVTPAVDAASESNVVVSLDTKPEELPAEAEPSAVTATEPSNAEQAATSNLPPEEPKEEIPATVPVPVVEVQEAGTTNPVNQETSATSVPGGVKKKGRILRPDVPAEAPIEPAVEGDKTGETKTADEAEKVNEQQSGNAILDSVDTGTLAESDIAVRKMEPNAEIKGTAPEGEEPKSGESATETQQSRKDTKILIVLFVAVVVIGAAAFTYNFIKKRNQRKAEGAREENGGGNALKRSLQNLTGSPTKADPEQGTELKPLMTNSDQKTAVAEYTDEKEKEGVKAEESK